VVLVHQLLVYLRLDPLPVDIRDTVTELLCAPVTSDMTRFYLLTVMRSQRLGVRVHRKYTDFIVPAEVFGFLKMICLDSRQELLNRVGPCLRGDFLKRRHVVLLRGFVCTPWRLKQDACLLVTNSEIVSHLVWVGLWVQTGNVLLLRAVAKHALRGRNCVSSSCAIFGSSGWQN